MRSFSTLGFTRRQRQRQAQLRAIRYIAGIAAVAAVGFVAYETGRAQNEAEIGRLSASVTALERQILDARAGALAAREQERSARDRALAIAERYRQDVPAGERLGLLQLIDGRLEEGVDVERLRFVLGEVEPVEACDDAIETKRFLPTTPVAVSRESVVTFGNNRITVTGQGTSARDEQGRPQSWFDLAEPVSIRFLKLDGGVTLAEGILPLTHRLVDGDREWRFQIRPQDERGFVEVSAQTCAFP